MEYKFSEGSEKVLNYAKDLTEELGHSYIGTEHILYGLAKNYDSVAGNILYSNNITNEIVKEKIIEYLSYSEKNENNVIGFTPKTKRLIENSYLETKKSKEKLIETEHILITILNDSSYMANKILVDLNVNTKKMYRELNDIIGNKINNNSEQYEGNNAVFIENDKKDDKTPNLNKYCIDLTNRAACGKLDPVIGREKETKRLIEILSRRMKNNPCLIGDAGVGKTAIVEGLAEKIINNKVPEELKDKKILCLDISNILAGSKYRGDFEERMKKCLNEAQKNKNIILFIDEIHIIVGTGAAEGAIDASNIMKPLLARGELQLIGATTINEYRKYIEKDNALDRRFQSILVEQPSKNTTIDIIKGIRDKYEAHHNVKITDDAIVSAVELSVRYINDRNLPDKAIDLIDEACARARLNAFSIPDKIEKIKNRIELIKSEKEESIKIENFERAIQLKQIEKDLKEKIEKENKQYSNDNENNVIEIKKEDIENVISDMTGIEISKINVNEFERFKDMEENLKQEIIGQDEAISKIVNVLKRNKLGINEENRPIGSFLFVGSSGVGKTELSKKLNSELFGSEDSIIRFDMSEYMEQNSVSKLIGSPPGYVGYEEGGKLSDLIRKKPYSVVLFDEIEKANIDVLDLLLQIIDDGTITDSKGKKIDFKNTIIIMTSNIGSEVLNNNNNEIGFSSVKTEEKNKEREVIKILNKTLKQEFLNRIDEIIVFNELKEEVIRKIIKKDIKELVARFKKAEYNVIIEEEIENIIFEKTKNNKNGARDIRRKIKEELEEKIVNKIINSKIINKQNEYIKACMKDDREKKIDIELIDKNYKD
ncbi:MAG: ATP-dependent Clp protease ATP-binding subunit [Clostridia bacterium]|nr:ATP-dependent Clp protease ATP-binding subunit [Clostridia bacterium]